MSVFHQESDGALDFTNPTVVQLYYCFPREISWNAWFYKPYVRFYHSFLLERVTLQTLCSILPLLSLVACDIFLFVFPEQLGRLVLQSLQLFSSIIVSPEEAGGEAGPLHCSRNQLERLILQTLCSILSLRSSRNQLERLILQTLC